MRRRGPAKLSQKRAGAALVGLLYGCAPEQLAGFTAASLAASYNVPLERAEALLAGARKSRGA